MMAPWTSYLCAGLAGFFAGMTVVGLGLLVWEFRPTGPKPSRDLPPRLDPLVPSFSDPAEYDPVRILGVEPPRKPPYDWALEEDSPEEAERKIRENHPTRLVDIPEMTDGSLYE